MRGIVAGVLTLIALQALTSNDKATANSGKLLVWLSAGLRHALSPDVAAIPTRKPPAKASTSKPSTAKPGEISLPRNPSVGGGTVTV
jgi:hypothetical protein